MKSDRKRIRSLCFSVACIQIVVLGAAVGARANPTITVTWDCAGTPTDPYHYHVDYTNPSFPDVELKAECESWKVKSVDGDNPGDIGEITATGAYNYGLSITDGNNGAGAREVKKIELNPQGDGSDAKYSNLTGGSISGDLTGALTLKETSGGSGGDLSLTIDGDADGNISAHEISFLSIGGDLTGDLEVDEITGSLSIGDDSLGTINIGELSGSLTISDEVSAPVYIISGGSGTITAGTVKALMKLDQSDSYDGTATFGAVDASGYVVTCGAAIGGTIHITGNVAGWVAATLNTGEDGLEDGALIDIDGNLSGYVSVTEDAVGDIEIGGDITSTGQILIHGDMEGDVTVEGDVVGDIEVDDNMVGDIEADDISGSLSIGGNAYGHVDLQEFTGSVDVTGDVNFSWFIVWGDGSGDITGGAVTSVLVMLAYGAGNDYSGTATFSSVASGGLVETYYAPVTGTINVTGNVAGSVRAFGTESGAGLAETGLIDIGGNVSGDVTLSQDADGDIEIAGSITATGKIHVYGDIAGDVTVDGDVDGEILADADDDGDGDITGYVTIDEEFNGSICGNNLSPLDYPFPRIPIGTLGDDALICGARPGCGDGTISSADPADGTHDSRQPHPPGDCSLSARQGIGSEDEPIEITLSEGGANNLDCWELCETGIEAVDTGQGCSTLSANAIDTLTETTPGVYEIVLERPISAGEWTTITYLGDDSYVTYASLPADANADETSAPADITALIDYLNEVDTPPYGDYSCDMDHSDACGPSDITRLSDLLNGTSKFISWNNVPLPSNTCP
jgi:cytoskeletal protein CcmA (bactofilin family)